jgi:4-hydroxythreonine-4-phosphate dehydrogenase
LKPKIAITTGDPAGIGPELCLRLLANEEIIRFCTPVVFGDRLALELVAAQCQLPLPNKIISRSQLAGGLADGQPTIVDVDCLKADQLKPGEVNAHTGTASFEYVEAAIEVATAGDIDAIATGPIHKEAWQAAGIEFPGHTELFAERAGTDRFCMMMTAAEFSCSLVTTHVGYRDVPNLLTTELILEVTELTHAALARIYGRPPKLVMLGLNPHAGEGGLFGNREEETIIQPAAAAARADGIDISDPLPPDTAFLPWRRAETDGYICMYHDQGLIPFKAFNFDQGVNITLGLPNLIRTSVDHGTALDIAWQSKADVSSLISAVRLATKLAAAN